MGVGSHFKESKDGQRMSLASNQIPVGLPGLSFLLESWNGPRLRLCCMDLVAATAAVAARRVMPQQKMGW